MQSQPERPNGTWAGLGVLAVGILIGALARPARWFERASSAPERLPFPALVPAQPPETPPANGLDTIELVIPEASAAVLERVRADALERGIITQTDADTVKGTLVFEGKTEPIELRIKGDWTDHVDSERWSYRIRLKKGVFRGMREFSIQAPKTRGYLWEWLMQEAARREHVLVPRSTYLNVVQNGHALGVYFLEEHFEKELLESQGRREGPIVVWDEGELWAALLQEGNLPAKGLHGFESRLTAPAHTPAGAEVRAYGEKRLSSLPGLNQALQAALDQMRGLRALAVAEQPESERWRALEALRELRARTLEDLVDVERLGCAHALGSLFQVEHALAWHNTRWYRDPVQARLEPILFDNAPQDPGGRDPIPFRATDLTAAFAHSPGYRLALFAHLGRMLRTGWLDEFLGSVEPELARFEAALAAEGPLPPGGTADEMRQRLREQVVYLRRVCLPRDGVGLEATYELTHPDRKVGEGWIEVRAWAATRSPVLVEGFAFSNGRFVPAATVLAAGSYGARASGQAVLLPGDGAPAVFRFPMDERLASLEHVENVKKTIRESVGEPPLDLDVKVRHRLVASAEAREERLAFRHRAPAAALDERPAAPGLDEALERHPFLRYDATRGELLGLAGTWDVQGDLVLPEGVPLRLVAGTTLRFPADAVLLATAALVFEGTAREPIVLEPLEGAETWRGVVVLGAGARSEWTEVTVRHTDAVARGGWIVTGGITFYRSPLTLLRCTFDGTRAEDGLNVFGADVLFEQVTFRGCHSDSFDGDFITGELRECVFEDGLADGIDVSGSDIVARDCRFVRMADKAFSIGERSRARIEGGEARDVAIGIASKDDSEVDVTGLVIEARNYALAAFVKKPEYGPARLYARQLRLEGPAPATIAGTGCVLEVDGTAVPTQEIDVEASYEEGVLGRAKH